MTSQEITSARCRLIGPADEPSKLWKVCPPTCRVGLQSYRASGVAPRLSRATAVETGLNVDPGAPEPWKARERSGIPFASSVRPR
jgi:hypothetical protein